MLWHSSGPQLRRLQSKKCRVIQLKIFEHSVQNGKSQVPEIWFCSSVPKRKTNAARHLFKRMLGCMANVTSYNTVCERVQ